MTCTRRPFLLRLCLAILPVLMLAAGGWAQGAMPGPVTAVICADGGVRTVRLDTPGAPARPDCSHCAACLLPIPLDLAPAVPPARPLAWRPVPHRHGAALPVLSHWAFLPLSRGPPAQTIRFPA